MLRDVKFLVVDDHPPIRAIVTAILKAADVRSINYAVDGASALDSLRLSQPDIIITDMLMTGMDGLDLVRLIRGAVDSPNPFLPIIMLTALTEARFVAEARDAGVTEFACKPISAGNLLARIDSVIFKPRQFVKGPEFFGPDRRRRAVPVADAVRRRASDGVI